LPFLPSILFNRVTVVPSLHSNFEKFTHLKAVVNCTPQRQVCSQRGNFARFPAVTTDCKRRHSLQMCLLSFRIVISL